LHKNAADDPAMTIHNTHLTGRDAAQLAEAPAMQRSHGNLRLTLKAREGRTEAFEAYQEGAAKVRFPRVEAGEPFEATLINTSGGITGGDRFSWTIAAGTGASATISGQAAERIYRRSAGVARIETTITVGDGASLAWLPQETIVFDRSAMRRTLTAEVHPNGRLLAAEAIVLGRAAMGEAARAVSVYDRWRVTRGGRILFADALRLEGDTVATLAGGATGGGARATATLILVAEDAEAQLDVAREAAAAAHGEAGASAWNGLLTARFLAPDGQTLRADLTRLITALRRTNMPRVWLC
jgi:urease accessory protein